MPNPPPLPPQILYPDGHIMAVSMWVNPGTGPVQWDGSVSANITGVDGAITDGAVPSIKATVFDLAASNPLATQIVDSSGNAITSFGGGTQYTEDAVAPAD